MEMHQIRYFLAVSRTLNFTRAAEDCHVAQPSLTRAVKLLEAELGADLFRRERNLTHLTDFGQRMLPLMRQCFDSAVSAKRLASSIKSGSVASLTLALSHTVSMAVLVEALGELVRQFPKLELHFARGTAADVAESLKKGEAALAVAGPVQDNWDRLDAWPLFTERFRIVVGDRHRLAALHSIDLSDLARDRFLMRSYCELSQSFTDLAQERKLDWTGRHHTASDADVMELIRSSLGFGVLPHSTPCPPGLHRLEMSDAVLSRTVSLYGVAGRERSAPASALMLLLRARDWSVYEA